MVHALNNTIAPGIDCTECRSCCKSLIHITSEEAAAIAAHLEISTTAFTEKYLEQTAHGKLMLNSIPCNFFSGTTCSIYAHRFTQCREFPHLHKANFVSRLFGTLAYYGVWPIILNVVEELKKELGFKTLEPE